MEQNKEAEQVGRKSTSATLRLTEKIAIRVIPRTNSSLKADHGLKPIKWTGSAYRKNALSSIIGMPFLLKMQLRKLVKLSDVAWEMVRMLILPQAIFAAVLGQSYRFAKREIPMPCKLSLDSDFSSFRPNQQSLVCEAVIL